MYHQTKKHLRNWFIPHEGNNHHPHALQHKHLALYSYTMIMVKVLLLGILFLSFPTIAQFSELTQARIAELANATRAQFNLPALKINPQLTEAAQLKLQDMLAGGYFAHTSPAGISPWEWFKQAGYVYTYAGENLAMNFTQAEGAHQAWLDSPTHRDNILNPNYSEIGVAVGVGEIDGQQTTLVVQLFGKTFVSSVAGVEAGPAPLAQPPALPEPAAVAEPTAPVEQPIVTVPEPALETTEDSLKAFSGQEVQTVSPEIGGGAEQQVTIQEAESTGFIANLVSLAQKFYWVIVIFVGLALLLKILVRINIQHKSVISHGALVIAIGLALLFLQLHFLEAVSGPVLVF